MFTVDRKQAFIVILLICSITFGAGYKLAQAREKNSIRPAVSVSPAVKPKKEKPRSVTVHVAGAVKNPGVYSFAEGARVVDAIKKAEETKEADFTYLNLAELIVDQQQVFVPKKGLSSDPVKSSGGAANGVPGKKPALTNKTNINKASVQDLDKLPGIGPSFAQRIVDYRSEHGGFKEVSDLLKVSGIGQKKYAQLKELVTVY